MRRAGSRSMPTCGLPDIMGKDFQFVQLQVQCCVLQERDSLHHKSRSQRKAHTITSVVVEASALEGHCSARWIISSIGAGL